MQSMAMAALAIAGSAAGQLTAPVLMGYVYRRRSLRQPQAATPTFGARAQPRLDSKARSLAAPHVNAATTYVKGTPLDQLRNSSLRACRAHDS